MKCMFVKETYEILIGIGTELFVNFDKEINPLSKSL